MRASGAGLQHAVARSRAEQIGPFQLRRSEGYLVNSGFRQGMRARRCAAVVLRRPNPGASIRIHRDPNGDRVWRCRDPSNPGRNRRTDMNGGGALPRKHRLGEHEARSDNSESVKLVLHVSPVCPLNQNGVHEQKSQNDQYFERRSLNSGTSTEPGGSSRPIRLLFGTSRD